MRLRPCFAPTFVFFARFVVDRPMRIAQLVSSLYPVDLSSTKAIYSHVAALTEGMVEAGHDVSVFGSARSCTRGRIHAVESPDIEIAKLPGDMQRHYNAALISDCYRAASDVDVIHSHFTLLSSFYAPLVATPTLISVHSPIRDEIRPLLQKYKHLSYVSFSRAQRLQMPELNWVATIYHGIDTTQFAFSATPEDYFLYLGRVTEEKGVLFAIQAAKAAGVPLVIAGGSYQAEGYWHRVVEPEINGTTVRYVGEAGLAQKIELLRGAKALLFPTQYDETFGLVMIEAMSCGTPVIGWNNGSVPEVIAHGRTGFVVDSVEGMTQAIQQIGTISRHATRERAERLFSKEKMTQGYLRVYERVIRAAGKEGLVKIG